MPRLRSCFRNALWRTARKPKRLHISKIYARLVCSAKKHEKVNNYLGWLANLLPDHFPLIRFIFFDSVEKSLALLHCQHELEGWKGLLDLILRKFCIMHILP